MRKSKQDYKEDGSEVKIMSVGDLQRDGKKLAEHLIAGYYIKVTKHGRELGMIVPFQEKTK